MISNPCPKGRHTNPVHHPPCSLSCNSSLSWFTPPLCVSAPLRLCVNPKNAQTTNPLTPNQRPFRPPKKFPKFWPPTQEFPPAFSRQLQSISGRLVPPRRRHASRVFTMLPLRAPNMPHSFHTHPTLINPSPTIDLSLTNPSSTTRHERSPKPPISTTRLAAIPYKNGQS